MVGGEKPQTGRCSQRLAEVTAAAQWKEQTKAAAAAAAANSAENGQQQWPGKWRPSAGVPGGELSAWVSVQLLFSRVSLP